MADYYYGGPVTEEVFAAWLDGSLTAEEQRLFVDECAQDADLQQLLDASDAVDDTFEDIVGGGYSLPDELYGDFCLPEIPLPEDDMDGGFGFDDYYDIGGGSTGTVGDAAPVCDEHDDEHDDEHADAACDTGSDDGSDDGITDTFFM